MFLGSIAVELVRVAMLAALIASAPPEPAPSGESPQATYTDGQLRLTARPGAAKDPNVVEGEITRDGKSYPYLARRAGDIFKGAFSDGADRFDCTMMFTHEVLTFETGGTTYQLNRQVAVKNPLAGGGSREPVGRADAVLRPPVPNPLEKQPGLPAPARQAAPDTPVTGAQAGANPVGGVGMRFENSQPDGKWRVTALKPGGPAEEAGIQPGDILTAVDEKPVDGMKQAEIGAMLRGSVGSTVRISTLTLYPGGGQTTATREVERADLNAPASQANAGDGKS